MPSYGGAHGPDGSKKSGDQGQGSRDSRGGNTGGAAGQGGSGFGGARFGGGPSPLDSRTFNSRYSQNTIATRPATLTNIGKAIIGGIPGPVGLATTALRGALTGNIDPYSGPIGSKTGYSYDGPNRFGTLGSAVFPGGRPNIGQAPVPGVNGPAGIGPMSGLGQQFMPGVNLNIGPSTLPSYGAQLPGYSFFGPQMGQPSPLKPLGGRTHTTGIRR